MVGPRASPAGQTLQQSLLPSRVQLQAVHRGTVYSRVWGRGWTRVKWGHEMQCVALTVWATSQIQQMSEWAGKLKELQGTIQEPLHECLLCAVPLSATAH